MSVLDFLFEGKAPKSVTTYGTSFQELPQWYSDYTQGLIAKANAIAAEPYQAYSGPRVAGLDPLQQAAYGSTATMAQKYEPTFGQAQSMFQQAGAGNTLGLAQPYLNQASNLAQQATQRVPEGISAYMNPYENAVVQRIGQLGQRQLTENLLPALQAQGISSGQFGGTRGAEAIGKALRDTQESTLAQQAALMQSGYGQAAQLMQSDLQRLLQAGQAQTELGKTTGALAAEDLSRQLEAGRALGQLGQTQQAAELQRIGALEAAGAGQQAQVQKNLDLAYKDFLEQRDYDRQNIAFLNAALRGLEIPTATTTTGTGPASVYQPSPLTQLAQGAAAALGISKLFP